MTTDHSDKQTEEQFELEEKIEAMNEVISRFEGWEIVNIGYWTQRYGEEDDETDWQRNNSDWITKVGIKNIGCYAVKVNEDKWKQWDVGEYHSSWDEIHKVWSKLNASVTERQAFFTQFYYGEMSNAMITGNILSAHRVLYDSIIWLNKQNDNGK